MKPSTLPTKRACDDSALLSSFQVPAKKLKKLKKRDALKHGRTKGYDHGILSHFYPRVISLRQHLLERLPKASRIRRRKLVNVGKDQNNQSEAAAQVTELLDSTLIGVPAAFSLAFSWPHKGGEEGSRKPEEGTKTHLQNYKKQFLELLQIDESYASIDGSQKRDIYCQSEIVDFCIWSIFEKDKSIKYPKHVICDGYERSAANRFSDLPTPERPIPGLFLKRQNEQAEMLKTEPWPQVLSLLGQAGQDIMIEMILNCGIFARLHGGSGSLFQICGVPLGDMKLQPLRPPKKSASALAQDAANSDSDSDSDKKLRHTPIEIDFCRNRMMYGRAILTARGTVKTGFRHLHVLNRCTLAPKGLHDEVEYAPYAYGDQSTAKIMAYIFPRQFGLHNVFTSKVDMFKTTQKFQDYTIRDEEIKDIFGYTGKGQPERIIKIPKRLRGEAHRLVWRLQILHKRCSYSQLLRHYCPTELDKIASSTAKGRKKHKAPEITLKEGENLTDYTTPLHQVSAFCRAVLTKIIPGDFWGVSDDGKHNQSVAMQVVDHFIRLRRFEKMNLHHATQDIKLASIPWLTPPALRGSKMSQTDRFKRLELLHEFVYYVFDSLLIPLIRSTFYVTETSIDKNHVFFFRHDVWRALSSPALVALKKEMFAEMPPEEAKRVLGQRNLGFSALRLLPKARTMRPIMNLKRRQRARNRRQNLEPSINSLLTPLHSVLKLEKARDPGILGSTLASVQDIFTRLREFRKKLPEQLPRLYFVKIDVQGAFDSIPQDAVLKVLNSLPREAQYTVAKHVEVNQGARVSTGSGEGTSKVVSGRPRRKWCSKAYTPSDTRSFRQCLEVEMQPAPWPEEDKQTPGTVRCDTVFHGKMAPRVYTKKYLLNDLLQAHVKANIVKVGKRYYVQKNGIPQGSVLSADLCNLFYAHMEAEKFDFLGRDGSSTGHTLLMRLIDDSLLITTDGTVAQRFAETMIRGVPAYGVTVNPLKTLANFACVVDGVAVPQLGAGETGMPFCGTVINCRTLSILRLRNKMSNKEIWQALTVEYSRNPGQTFQQRVLNFFRAYSHAMFYDSTHNTARIAYANLRKSMFDIARRTWAYIRSLPPARKPASRVVIRTIESLAEVVHSSVKSKTKSLKFPGYKCELSRAHVFLVTLEAFSTVFCPGKSRYLEVVEWLNGEVYNAASVAAGRSRKKVARKRVTF